MDESVRTNERRWPQVLRAMSGLAVFSLAFVALDQAVFRYVDSRFPTVGQSASLATSWGLISRTHVLVPVALISSIYPAFVGLRWGRTGSHTRLLAAMLVTNCGVVATYLLLSGTTPYSGNQWLFTEVITVPVIEELLWRGIVLSAVLLYLRRSGLGRAASHIAVWSTGLTFGVLHFANALAGVPLGFVTPQAIAAMAWGVMYGYARTTTDSIVPPIILHSAMNLVVVALG